MGPDSQTGSDIIQRPPPPMDRMTEMCKNITLSQTLFAGSKNGLRLSLAEADAENPHDAKQVNVQEKYLAKNPGICPCVHRVEEVRTDITPSPHPHH